MKCKCKEANISTGRNKNEINISCCDVNVRKNRIDIQITREPDTPLIKELREQIAELQELGLKFDKLDQRIAEVLEEMDLATKAYLAEVLENYATTANLENMRDAIKEWANGRFMRKMFLSQEAYDALEEKEENVMYCII
jgi:hypothetical protein